MVNDDQIIKCSSRRPSRSIPVGRRRGRRWEHLWNSPPYIFYHYQIWLRLEIALC